MAFLRCDICGGSTDHQGSWDTPIKIICGKCSTKKEEISKMESFIHEEERILQFLRNNPEEAQPGEIDYLEKSLEDSYKKLQYLK